jgi:hypothetical protein
VDQDTCASNDEAVMISRMMRKTGERLVDSVCLFDGNVLCDGGEKKDEVGKEDQEFFMRG